MCVMYATQPLQPHFEQILEISKFQASIFTTAILVPLAFASIIYGYFLEKISIRKVLIGVFFIFSVSEFIFAFANLYSLMISIRIMQGFIVPAALTGIMSYISQSVSHTKVASAMGAYIGITIAGGFIGRFLSGFFTDIFGWRFFFVVLGILTLIATILLTKTLDEIQTKFVKPRLKNIVQILSIPRNSLIFLAIFGVFFVFQAVLNILPFELVRLDGAFSGSKTGFMYAGYIIGIFISFNVAKIVNLCKTAPNAIILGILIYIASLQFLRIENFYAIFISMLVFYLGSFIAHPVATAFVNKRATSHKGITNGLYVSFYYAGGALGSFAPGMIYEFGGWNMFLSSLSLLLCLSLFFIWKLKKYEKSKILSK